MKSRNKLSHPTSLDQFLALLGPGQQLSISLPDAAFANRFVPTFLAGHPQPARLHILRSATPDEVQGQSTPGPSDNLDNLKSVRDGVLLLRRCARSLPRNRVVIIDLARNLPRWLSSPASRLNFVSESLHQLQKSRRRCVWLLSEDHYSLEQLSSVKDASDFFLSVRFAPPVHYAQFISAAGHHDPQFFLPRLVEIGDESILWSKPLEATEEAIQPRRAVKRLEARLSESERQNQFVFQNSSVPQAIFTQRRLLKANPAFYTAFPWVSSDTPGKPSPHDFFTRANGDFLKELFYQPAQPQVAGKTLTRNITLKGLGGEARVIEVHAVVRAEPERNTYHFWFLDVTRQAEAFNELKDSQEFYRSLLDSSAGAVALVRGGRFEYVNRGLMEMFGYMVQEEFMGREVTDFVLAREKKLLTQKTNPKSRTAGAVDRFEFLGIRKDRAKVYVQAFAESVTMGGKAATLLYLRDKTGEVEAEEAQRRKEREQVSLDKITHAIHRSVELLEVFSAGLQTSVEQLGFDGGGVYALDEDTVGLTLATYQGLSDNLVEKLGKQTIHDGVTGYLAKTLEPVVLSIADYPPYLPYKSLFESAGLKTVAYVPLLAWEALAGILFLCSRKSPDHFSFSPDLLTTIAQHSGSSIQNARNLERVRASELRYRSAVESVPDVVYQANSNGTLIFMSPQVGTLVGYSPDDFIRNPDAWRSIVHPDDRVQYSRRVSMQMQKADTVEIQYRVLPKGKAAYRWVRDGVRYTRDANGEVIRISGIVTDITARVEEDGAPSSSQEESQRILESMEEAVAVLDRDFRFVGWNKALEDLTGAGREFIIGRNALEGPVGVPDFEGHAQRALSGERTSSRDFQLTRKGHPPRWCWARFSPLRDTDGTVSGVVIAITDVTDRKNLEDEARESEETLRHVLDAMGDALMITDLEGTIWEVNREFTEFTGYTKREVRGTVFPYPWLLEEEMSRFVKWIAELREEGALRDYDMHWKRRDGREVAISLNTTLLRSYQGEPVAMLNLARNITERKQMSTELTSKSLQVEMLNRIISKANTTVDFAGVFDVIAQEVGPLVPFDQLNVGLLSDDRSRMTLHACMSPIDKTLPVGTTVPVGESVSSLAIREGKAVIVGDLLDHRGLPPDNIGARQGFRSQMTVPIFFNEQLLGTLNVAGTSQNLFAEKDLAVLQPIADQIGAMIDRSRLFQRVTDEVKRVTLLYELGKRLTGARDRKALFEAVYQEISSAVECDTFAFDDLDHEREALHRFCQYSGSKPDGSTGESAKEIGPEEQALLWGVVTMGVGFCGTDRQGRAVLAVPVRSRDAIAGVMWLSRGRDRPYGDAHLRLLESIGNLTEIALDRVRLYEDTVAKSEEIQARNKELDDFAYVVSHDLKEPLITVEAYSRILKSEHEEKIGEEGRQYLASLIQSSSRMKSLIDDLLTLSRLGQAADVEEEVSIGEIVQDVVGELGFSLRERGAVVNVPPGLPSVRYNPTQLGMVFRNLIANGLKFNRSAEPRIDIGWRDTDDGLSYVFSVSDNGIGIPEEHFTKIFGIFQRLDFRDQFAGTGAGLTIVNKIIQNHGGKIWVESVVGKGSCFYFTVPKHS